MVPKGGFILRLENFPNLTRICIGCQAIALPLVPYTVYKEVIRHEEYVVPREVIRHVEVDVPREVIRHVMREVEERVPQYVQVPAQGR